MFLLCERETSAAQDGRRMLQPVEAPRQRAAAAGDSLLVADFRGSVDHSSTFQRTLTKEGFAPRVTPDCTFLIFMH